MSRRSAAHGRATGTAGRQRTGTKSRAGTRQALSRCGYNRGPSIYGEMSERFKEHAWKACIRCITVSRVRIPLSPPQNERADSMSAFLFCRIDARVGFEGAAAPGPQGNPSLRSEEHTSELQSLMRISYAVFCLKKKKQTKRTIKNNQTKQTQ